MIKLRRLLPALLAALLLLSAFVACSSYNYGYDDDAKFNMYTSAESSAAADYDYEVTAPADNYDEGYYNPPNGGGEYDDYGMDMVTGGGDGGWDDPLSLPTPVASDRKIITTVTLRMESREYDACVTGIYRAVEASGGYVEYSDIAGSIQTSGTTPTMTDSGFALTPMGAEQYYHDGSTSGYVEGEQRFLYLRIRVPQSDLGGFLSAVEASGNVLSKQESSEDITLDYVDVESHKLALQAEQERLLSMLEQALDVESMIALEQRLSEVRYQLGRYESQLRVMENQVSYSTVHLTLNEVVVYTEKPPQPNPTVAQRISRGFAYTITGIGNFWVDVFIAFMVNIVYIVGVIVVVLVVVLLVRRYLRLHPRIVAEGPIAEGAALGSTVDPESGMVATKPAVTRGSLREWIAALFVPPFHRLDKLMLIATAVHLFLAVGGPFIDEYSYYWDGILLFIVGFIVVLYLLFAYVSVLSVPLTVIALFRRFGIQRKSSEATRAAFQGVGCWVLIILNVFFALCAWSYLIDSFF